MVGKPPRAPPRRARARIDTKLAVTLMQSGYRALESLDVVPMQDFQIAFWKYRADRCASGAPERCAPTAEAGG